MNASRSLEFQIRNKAGKLGGYGQLWEGGGGGGGEKTREEVLSISNRAIPV
jgi:hypothetical protein